MSYVPSNYRVLLDGEPVAHFVYSAHVTALIQNAGRPMEDFTVQFIADAQKEIFLDLLLSKDGRVMGLLDPATAS